MCFGEKKYLDLVSEFWLVIDQVSFWLRKKLMRFPIKIIGYAYLLDSTSTIPCFKMSWPIPFLAMALKALLLRTKSVWLLWLRSIVITLVPSLVQSVAFLHLICKCMTEKYISKQIKKEILFSANKRRKSECWYLKAWTTTSSIFVKGRHSSSKVSTIKSQC